MQDISRTFLAIAGIFVSYSGHEKDEEGKSQTLMAKLWPATPHKLQKLSKLGNYSLNIFPFFYGFLSTLSALQQYPPWKKNKEMTKQNVLIPNLQPSEELVKRDLLLC